MPLQIASSSPLEGLPLTLYGRVSKDVRGGRSVSQQLKRGRRWGAQHGCVIVGEWSDNDKSASHYATKAREQWPRVEEQILAGETRILWIYEISRGTRDLEVWARLARVCRERGVYIVLDEDVYDPTKPSHMRQLNQLMVDAVYESDKTAERIARDAEEMAEVGHPWGNPGFGYRREYDPDSGDLLRQVPDPAQSEFIRSIADRLEAGESPNAIAEDLNRQGVPTPAGVVAGQERTRPDGSTYRARGWTYQVVARLMLRPALMGKRVHRGDIKPVDAWDPIIEPERWELLKARLDPTPRGREGSVVHELSGLAICDICEGPMYGYVRPGKSGPAYRCAGPWDGAPGGKAHVQRAKHLLEEHVATLLFERFSDPDVLDELRGADASDGEVRRAQERLLELHRELEELYADVEAGRVSRRMAQADEARLQAETREVSARTRRRADDPLVEALIEGDPAQVWKGWGMHQRREALRATAEEIRVLKVGPVGRRRISVEESVRIVWRGVV